ncbi:daptide-type RiPP [Sphaerimonospora mesophila]
MHDNRAAPALELAMQELEPMDAPMWETAIGRASMVSLLFSVGVGITIT